MTCKAGLHQIHLLAVYVVMIESGVASKSPKLPSYIHLVPIDSYIFSFATLTKYTHGGKSMS